MHFKNIVGIAIMLHAAGTFCSNKQLGCPKHWKRFEKSCYLSPKSSLDWRAAQFSCSKYNAHLVTVSTARENSFLIREFVTTQQHSRHFWLGLHRSPSSPSKWVWVDASPVTFKDWYSGQPDNYRHEEFCGEMYVLQVRDGVVKWNDLNCSRASSFICEKEILGLPSCTEDNGGCQHFCLSSDDRIVCKCKDGLITENNGAVCLDPRMYWSQEAQQKASSSYNMALLVIQLLSLILLLPMALVLVSFYRRVSKQRRRAKAQLNAAVVNSPMPQDESFGNQNTRLTNATYENSCINDNV
ncbi:brevican core protein-like [Stylophora pistillata]|uniref:Collectin-12 n=1 Tax=Stylophora pistillata TaxID=50429 RepID=A0A2B4SLE5_STYPI|nr:brevican core protein-like [Stylophora pistillata]PFX29700.1 Collectin-12 [Stylophora pistillata]